MEPVFKVSNLTVLPASGGDPIVRDVNFAIKPGEVLALIGESGSGKTTIALSALGYVRPGMEFAPGASVELGGTDILKLPGRALRALRGRKVAYIAQSAAASFNPALSLGFQVTETAVLQGLATRGQARARAVGLYEELQLPAPGAIGERYPHQVSGGQLQRVMAAMALCASPELLVFDEPTTALDVTTQISVLRVFKEAIRHRRAAAIYVSHDLAVVSQIADHIIVLKNGRVVEHDTVHNVVERPAKRYTQVLMAASDPDRALENRVVAVPATAEAPAAPLLEATNILAGYGKIDRVGNPAVPILKNISLTVAPRSIVGVVGESGSGKSTLARVIAGLLPRAAGELRLNGRTLPPSYQKRDRGQLRAVQLVMQMADVALNRSHTIGTILGRPMTLMLGIKGSERDDRVAALLDRVKLPRDFARRLPTQLSGGQKQRVNLARALAAEPDLILCDEVTSALDTVVRQSMIRLIDELRTTMGLTFLFISHDISTIAALADRTIVMSRGEIVEDGATEAVIHDSKHPYTKVLMGSVPHLRIGWLEEAIAERDKLAASLRPGVLTD